jgi:hypothetical protein
MGDLPNLYNFFLLHFSEYTHSHTDRHTVPLCKQGIRLWRDGYLLDNDAPLPVLQQADAITICLENQMNRHKNASLHHTTSGNPTLGPVQSGILLLDALRGLLVTMAIGSYLNGGQLHQVTASKIRSTIKLAAINDNFQALGYDISRIGTHSLHLGGAMHPKLAGYNHDIIQKRGR